MTLEEAIEHCKEKSCEHTRCAEEHNQLAQWLTELKTFKRGSLRERFKTICELYGDELNRLWETDGDWIRDGYQTFEVADCYISLHDVCLLVDRQVDFDVFWEWYHYDQQIRYGMELGKIDYTVNLENWLNGYPETEKIPADVREAWEREYWEKFNEQS